MIWLAGVLLPLILLIVGGAISISSSNANWQRDLGLSMAVFALFIMIAVACSGCGPKDPGDCSSNWITAVACSGP